MKAFTLDFEDGTARGLSRSPLRELSDRDLVNAINGLQMLAEGMTADNSYELQVETKDGYSHRAPVYNPAVTINGLIQFDEESELCFTTAESFPEKVHVSNVRSAHIEMY